MSDINYHYFVPEEQPTEDTKGKNREKTAVGLKYSAPKAPELIAKGFGELADDIVDVAKSSGVMVHQDDELAKYLARLDVGAQVPKDVYVIIAELIAWSYIVQGKKPEQWNNMHKKVNESC